MKSSNYLIRLTRVLVLGAVVAGTAASVAGAYNSRPPDVRDAAGAITGTYLGSPPDVRDAAATNLAVSDVFERYATAHPYGVGLSFATESFVGRPPDVRDAAALNVAVPDVLERFAASHPYGIGISSATESTLLARPPDVRDAAASASESLNRIGLSSTTHSTPVSRPPDVRDAAQALATGSVSSQSRGFDWGDWAIGIGTGMGLILFLAGGLVMGRQLRHHVQTA
jgi:hypothetical protein